VYCAVVPEIGIFALADDLMTGNCPVHSLVTTKQYDDALKKGKL
jgi:hypothetical protein